MPKRQSIKDLKKDARLSFEEFIAKELLAKADVATDSLALGFYDKNEQTLKRLAKVLTINQLVKWADDILNRSIADETARNGGEQMLLPLSLSGIQMPGAFSFINGANDLRFVANYKARKFHLESHAYIMRKHRDEVIASTAQFDTFLDVVLPVMDDNTTLPEALKILRDNEASAA